MNTPKHTNSLIHASSPYLLQHAHNPVDWNEWNEAAWTRAKTEDKLVLVSIGYSACHWCHVMEKHCFEDEKIAGLMNAWFVNIKVDREERPDVDLVYMDACQVMTGRGGWPLNVFCLPDGRPVYAGTYFPPESWEQILIELSSHYRDDKPGTLAYATRMMQTLLEMNRQPAEVAEGKFSRRDLGDMYATLSQGFDLQQGGRKGAPKFPMPNNLEFVLDHFLMCQNKEISDYLHLSLLKMANGGIYDQLRGGFCRYSVDAHWFAPHFEKMLYDNAQLISIYARAFGVFDAPLYKTIAAESLAFCRRELKSEDGGYYSALDADSEGVEGKFYVFTDEELKANLNAEEYRIACIVFACTPAGNWEHGQNILHRILAPLQVLEKAQISAIQFETGMKEIRRKLMAVQDKRIRPGLDNKIITCWNGLMLKALADSAMFLREKNYLQEAEELGEWLWTRMFSQGQLYRIFAKGKASIHAFSEDYAALIQGYLALYEANQSRKWLEKAMILADACILKFHDPESDLFSFSDRQSESLIYRKTDISDDVISSANSTLCIALQKLGVLCDREALSATGAKMLRYAAAQTLKFPGWHSQWARAAQMEAMGTIKLQLPASAVESLSEIRSEIPSWCVVTVEEQNSPSQFILCQGNTCLEPVTSKEQLKELYREALMIQEQTE